MKIIVMLEPERQLRHNGFGIRGGVHRDVIAPEGFDEGLGHAIRLQAAHRRRAWFHTDVAKAKEPGAVERIASLAVYDGMTRIKQSGYYSTSSSTAWTTFLALRETSTNSIRYSRATYSRPSSPIEQTAMNLSDTASIGLVIIDCSN